MTRLISLTAGFGLAMMLLSAPSQAIKCANGVYHAGCVGPNGAAAVNKYPRPPVPPRGQVDCASGPYRAGCAGPNGAAVVRRPY
jgi:hypothetical protein